jgi:hypothetical protein
VKLEEPINRTAKDISEKLPINLTFVLGFNEISGADKSEGKGYLFKATDQSIFCFGVQ